MPRTNTAVLLVGADVDARALRLTAGAWGMAPGAWFRSDEPQAINHKDIHVVEM